MRQRLVALALVLGMVCVGPMLAGEVSSPATQQSWFDSTGTEFGPGIDPNGLVKFGPGIDPGSLNHGPVIDPGGLEHGPAIDPGG